MPSTSTTIELETGAKIAAPIEKWAKTVEVTGLESFSVRQYDARSRCLKHGRYVEACRERLNQRARSLEVVNDGPSKRWASLTLTSDDKE